MECKEVKEYLDSIGLPYDEKETGDMKVLQMQYNHDLCAIFPPVDDCPRYSVILAYNGAVQSGGHDGPGPVEGLDLQGVDHELRGLCVRR